VFGSIAVCRKQPLTQAWEDVHIPEGFYETSDARALRDAFSGSQLSRPKAFERDPPTLEALRFAREETRKQRGRGLLRIPRR